MSPSRKDRNRSSHGMRWFSGEGGFPRACHPLGGMEKGPFHPGLFHPFSRMAMEPSRRLLRPAVLLLLAEKPTHGYGLMEKLRELGMAGSMDPSMVYRLLRMLEASGMAESSLDDTGAGPARKVYRLTPQGMEMLDMWMSGLEGMLETLQMLRERYHKLERDA